MCHNDRCCGVRRGDLGNGLDDEVILSNLLPLDIIEAETETADGGNMKKTFQVDVSWTVTGGQLIEAESEDDARRLAYEMPLSNFNGGYLDDSFAIDCVEAETETADECWWTECWCHDPSLSHDWYCTRCGCGPRFED